MAMKMLGTRALASVGRERAAPRIPTIASTARAHWPLLLVACIGVATAFYRLGTKGLWGDEVWQVAWSQQQPLGETFQRFRAPPDLPLSFLLVQLSTTFGSDPFWVRLPSAALGAVTVVLLYLLARRLFGRAIGLTAALLLAVAPYHVWYAQDARPYAALACYSLLTLLFFERLLRRPSPGNALGFTVATILNLYNHLFALFPLLVELVVGVGWVVLASARARRAGGPELASARARARLLAGGVGGGAVVALLVAVPLFGGVARYIANGGPGDGAAPTRVTPDTVVDLLALFGSGYGWPLLLTTALLLTGLGALAYRRDTFMIVSLAWLVLPLAMLWLVRPRHMFIPRYVLFMQPVYVLLVAYGLVSLSRGIVALQHRTAPARPNKPGALGVALPAVAVAAMAAATFTPAWRGYAVEKTNNWSAMCSYLHRSAGLGDVITGNTYTGGLMDWCFKGTTAVSLVPSGSYALSALAADGRDIWYILVGTDSPDLPYVRHAYAAIPRAEWDNSGLDPITTYDSRFTYPQAEYPAGLYHYRATSLPSRLDFHDTRGAILGPGWPDFAQIGPGGREIVRLRLAATRPRVLETMVLRLVGRDLDIVANHTILVRLRPRATRLSWRVITAPLPPGLPDAVLVEFRNPGVGVSAVSMVALRYGSPTS